MSRIKEVLIWLQWPMAILAVVCFVIHSRGHRDHSLWMPVGMLIFSGFCFGLFFRAQKTGVILAKCGVEISRLEHPGKFTVLLWAHGVLAAVFFLVGVLMLVTLDSGRL